MYYTYIIRVEGGALYTGIAKNLSSRMADHAGQGKRCAKFTRSRRLLSLEALWSSSDRACASRLEYALKTLTKKQKEALLSDERLTWVYLPRLEREDYVRHPEARLELFLKPDSPTHSP